VLYAVAGFSRSGKTTWVADRLASARRLLVWDWPKREWAVKYRCRRVESFEELRAAVLPGAPPARIAFSRISETPDADFEAWARLAWVYVRAHGAPVVAEELSSVTNPGKAPAAWGNICRMGLGFGSDIYAITQRPAESDKTSLGNAQVIHCGLMGTLDDRRTMARYLDVPLQAVEVLKQFEWIERDRRTGALTSGRTRKRR
jgi:hypothetical protein